MIVQQKWVGRALFFHRVDGRIIANARWVIPVEKIGKGAGLKEGVRSTDWQERGRSLERPLDHPVKDFCDQLEVGRAEIFHLRPRGEGVEARGGDS